jgi:hypothetical protein
MNHPFHHQLLSSKSKHVLLNTLLVSLGIVFSQTSAIAQSTPSSVSVTNLSNQVDPIIVTATRTPPYRPR